MSEEAYFFKLSKYKNQLIKFVEGYIVPEKRKREILSRLKNEGLKDLEFIVSNAEIAYIPNVGVNISADQLKSISKIIDSLEELDDVQEVFTNFDIEEKELETLLSE